MGADGAREGRGCIVRGRREGGGERRESELLGFCNRGSVVVAEGGRTKVGGQIEVEICVLE